MIIFCLFLRSSSEFPLFVHLEPLFEHLGSEQMDIDSFTRTLGAATSSLLPHLALKVFLKQNNGRHSVAVLMQGRVQ